MIFFFKCTSVWPPCGQDRGNGNCVPNWWKGPPLINNEYPEYDTKLRLMVRLHFWKSGEYEVNCSLRWHPGPLWPVIVVPVMDPSMHQIDVRKLLVLERNAWIHTTVRKLFVLHRNTWIHTNMSKLLVLVKSTWNHTTLCKFFVFDRNTWNHTYVCKLFVLDKNTWDHITMCKLLVLDRNTRKKCELVQTVCIR